ncbi:acyltransferase [Aestuariivivens sediminis]|uniref:acyltransferase n=1 Tax=Aestuariivivens sediminis TaxID=2913557 RepID=UPI001F5798C3|nr:acyltransferase [Aestuariivivens sediminis]
MNLIKKVRKQILQFAFTLNAKIYCKNYKSFKAFGYTRLTKNTFLGNNVNFNGFKVLGSGKVTIGDNFHSGKGCTIITQVHNYKGNSLPYDNTYIVKDTTIEENVWFGNNVTVLGGVTIGEGAIIQAGSVVVNNINPLEIAGGHPAKPFSKRNREHYYKLKSNNKFH